MIRKIIRLENDMVMVFDEDGEQMPEYQGHYDDVRDRILEDAPAGAFFSHWFGYSPRPAQLAPANW